MENLDIDKFLDNDYDTIAKPDYSSLSLEERASRGDADAQNELGTAYMQGYGVQLDYKKRASLVHRGCGARTHRRVCESWHLLPYRARYSQKL